MCLHSRCRPFRFTSPLPFHVRAQVPASLALISGAPVAYTDFHGRFAPSPSPGSEVALARWFAPPVGSSSWNHGVHSFSKYQVRVLFVSVARPHPPTFPPPAGAVGLRSSRLLARS